DRPDPASLFFGRRLDPYLSCKQVRPSMIRLQTKPGDDRARASLSTSLRSYEERIPRDRIRLRDRCMADRLGNRRLVLPVDIAGLAGQPVFHLSSHLLSIFAMNPSDCPPTRIRRSASALV